MIQTARRDEFTQITQHINKLANQLIQQHFGEFSPTDSWLPAINVYQLERRLVICMDLAGLEPKSIEVTVQPGRLMVRGFRAAPDPRSGPESMRIVTMEIDHGPFCRVIHLPDQIELGSVQTEYACGMLWVKLPMREQA